LVENVSKIAKKPFDHNKKLVLKFLIVTEKQSQLLVSVDVNDLKLVLILVNLYL